ncbi:MAG: type II toxin-antitoxin system VapC family toxin [bacterium]|nr:type II toxin-antitoxin system VapC family toxin [bacterium]
MTVVYLESSAVLHWLLGQARAAEVRRAVDRAELVLTSTLTTTECERVLIRAEDPGGLKGGDAQRLRGMLERAQAAWTRMSVSDDVLTRAARPFPVEPVRTLDAIHLATALEFAAVYPDLRVLSYDRRIRGNAEALGIL